MTRHGIRKNRRVPLVAVALSLFGMVMLAQWGWAQASRWKMQARAEAVPYQDIDESGDAQPRLRLRPDAELQPSPQPVFTKNTARVTADPVRATASVTARDLATVSATAPATASPAFGAPEELSWNLTQNAGITDPPGMDRQRLGVAPGSSGAELPRANMDNRGLLPGVGGSSARLPVNALTPTPAPTAPAPRILTPPMTVPNAPTPPSAALALPDGPEDPGPPDGLTLDQAFSRALAANPTLRSAVHEIGKARADVLTAGLRANPILNFQTQYIPYGSFNPQRAGGPTEYDVGISHPLDLSGKRKARVAVAAQAEKVVEAQYQNAARLEIRNVANAFVDVLVARQTIRLVEANLRGLESAGTAGRQLFDKGVLDKPDVQRLEILSQSALVGRNDALNIHRQAVRRLAVLLGIPAGAESQLQIHGSLVTPPTPVPNAETLIPMALRYRPDWVAFHLGYARAHAEVHLARANRFPDIFLNLQPYMHQDLSPFANTKSTTAWGLGVTVPLPVYDRNQGNIARARHNVTQTAIELQNLQRQIESEVSQAVDELNTAHTALDQIETTVLPKARVIRENTYNLFVKGNTDVLGYLSAQREYNDAVKTLRDAQSRHRRALLDLNTAVGLRIFP